MTVRVEKWECRVCSLPCYVEILSSDEKLPAHLADRNRFVKRDCLCEETTPRWEKLTTG